MRAVSDVAVNPDPEVDCFFVYHTVNHDPEPGNTITLSNTDPATVEPVLKIAAHYRGLCRVFAPLYHQMSSELPIRHIGLSGREHQECFRRHTTT